VVRNGIRLYHINSGYWKSWVHTRVGWPDDQPGGWHLHRETTDEYLKQIVAEELVRKASGAIVWVVKSRANHYLDCEVLAAAAAGSLNVHKLQPLPDKQPPPSGAPVQQATQPVGFKRRTL
jgi:phage terminase large subunit GpA-like protein